MTENRTLALRRELLAELTSDQLHAAYAAGGDAPTHKLIGCGTGGNTADTTCTVRPSLALGVC